jgi:serralysin
VPHRVLTLVLSPVLAASLALVAPVPPAPAAPAPAPSSVPSSVPSAVPSPAARGGDGHGDHPVTELVGQYENLPQLRRRQVTLEVSRWGYRFRGGGVGNRMVVTEVGDRLRFADSAARSWRNLPGTCRKQRVRRGVAAVCSIPRRFSQGRMFLEIWPRLGDDHVDGRTLSARYRMWVLTDAGDDRITLGRGADFANGAFDDDVVSGGAGNDWVRTGVGRNRVSGGAGDDEVAGGDGPDRISGGPGRDRLFGGPGGDVLRGDADADTLGGGPGRDTAYRDRGDRVFDCEVVRS